MYAIRPEFCIRYSSFLQDIRRFFKMQEFLEVETPLLNRTGSVEAQLDSFQVMRNHSPKSPSAPKQPRFAGYLITSPEYRLKTLLSHLHCNLYQISHCFRSGDVGQHHLEEFLMLEWYLLDSDEFGLMDQCTELLQFLIQQSYSSRTFQLRHIQKRSVEDVFREYANCGVDEHSLLARLQEWTSPVITNFREMSYSDLFFTVFLNFVEPHLGKEGPEFLYHYPSQLSALSQIKEGYARRFELYWHSVELANAYYELTKKEDYLRRFAEENEWRIRCKKESMELDQDLLKSLEKGLPECSGIALGLDRLFLVLMGQETLKELYHYPESL